MSSPPTIRKASLGGLDCYLQGKDFLGNDYWLFLGIFLVGSLVGGLVPLILIGAIWCGFAKCLLIKERGQPVEFGQLFDGFNYFVQGLVAVLLIMLATLAALIPFFIILLITGIVASVLGDAAFVIAIPGFLLAYAYLFAINCFFQIALVFASCLIVERNMDGLEAVKAAYSGIMKNLSGLFVVGLVGLLIVLVGMMLCIIPGILALPMILGGHFVCYRKIFPHNQANAGAQPPVKPVMG